MELSELQHRLIEKLRDGLPIGKRPYALIALELGVPEETVIETFDHLIKDKVINRFGMIVRHRSLGYRANAMCVFDIADDLAPDIGKIMANLPYVTLCYRRERVKDVWPYNLYCMIHGRDRLTVRAQIRHMIARLDLGDIPSKILFSKQCFTQRAGKYGAPSASSSLDSAALTGGSNTDACAISPKPSVIGRIS
ncbi:Lrp/AsnC family transcriptional regulator [Thalassospira alkalitolerans]|uniref:siroheme decarboxylase subunit beta n=1 Tax=Thalassospira alkalitolerans TaxID=1293890 RepID=UPI000A1FB3B6|nr:Lrp/AsnC family transcriptional regulator [Thalassospira alkalitolerans]|tara:strand:- start:69223 stop:69804 length:582 start_codon:yes stop_codon:yes gene_type:complete